MNWSPLIWILAVVAIVLITLLATGTLHTGAIDVSHIFGSNVL